MADDVQSVGFLHLVHFAQQPIDDSILHNALTRTPYIPIDKSRGFTAFFDKGTAHHAPLVRVKNIKS